MNKNDLAREIASRMSVTVTMASQLVDTLCATFNPGNKKNVSDAIRVRGWNVRFVSE